MEYKELTTQELEFQIEESNKKMRKYSKLMWGAIPFLILFAGLSIVGFASNIAWLGIAGSVLTGMQVFNQILGFIMGLKHSNKTTELLEKLQLLREAEMIFKKPSEVSNEVIHNASFETVQNKVVENEHLEDEKVLTTDDFTI